MAAWKSLKMLNETGKVELIKDDWEGRRKLTFSEFQLWATGPVRQGYNCPFDR